MGSENFDDEKIVNFGDDPEKSDAPDNDINTSNTEVTRPDEYVQSENIAEETADREGTTAQNTEEPLESGYQWSGSSYHSSTPQGPVYTTQSYTAAGNGNPGIPDDYTYRRYDSEHVQEEARPAPQYQYNRGTPPTPPKKKKGHGKVIALVVAAMLVVCIGVGSACGYGVYRLLSEDDGDAIENNASAETVVEDETAEVTESATNESDGQVTLGGSNNVSSTGATGSMTASEIYDMACQQVVGITTSITSENVFGQSTTSAVSGTGFIISDDGYIATNYHVISDAVEGGYEVTVMMFDGTEYTAEIIGGDEDSDVAVLKIDATGLNAVTLGDSNDMAVGETVYAVGNPLGELTYTMTAGIVSALDREIATDDETTINMFQLDAAVNSGNSGGPVYNTDGEVIGIVTAKYSSTGVEGLSFAIPINDAVALIEDIIENGYVTGKAYMGITVVTVSSSVAQYYNMVEGAYVYAVDEDSCAAAAGLQVGDIITAMEGEEITSSSDLVTMKKQYRAGDTVTLDVYRSGETLQLSLTFDEEVTTTTTETETETDSSGMDNYGQYGSGSGGYGYSPFSGSAMN